MENQNEPVPVPATEGVVENEVIVESEIGPDVPVGSTEEVETEVIIEDTAGGVEVPYADSAEEIVEDVRIILQARPGKSNVTMDVNPLDQKQEGLYSFDKLDPKVAIVPLPPEEIKEVNEIAAYFTPEYLKEDPEGARWASLLRNGMRNNYAGGLMRPALEREGSNWKQYLEHENSKLSTGTVNVAAKPGEKVTGARAVAHVRAQLHGGTPKQIMLPHTGFWVTMRSLGDTATVDLHRRMVTDKIELGRYTFGQAFSNYSAISAGAIMEHVWAMVYDSTLKGDMPDLGDIVLCTDMPLLVAGAATTNNPNGFNYSRAVLNNAGEKMSSRQGVVSINKMTFYDNSAFTPWQRSHMAQRNGRNMTLESLEKYRDEFTLGKSRTIQLNENVSIELRIPTVNEYLNSGSRWVNGIALMVDKAFALPPTDDMRNKFIETQGKATNMRQFAHWVKSITTSGGVYEGPEEVDALLDDISGIDDIADLYLREVRKYIADVTVGIVAIPVEEGEPVNGEFLNPRFPHLVPIDTMYTFFTLLVQRVEQIMARK